MGSGPLGVRGFFSGADSIRNCHMYRRFNVPVFRVRSVRGFQYPIPSRYGDPHGIPSRFRGRCCGFLFRSVRDGLCPEVDQRPGSNGVLCEVILKG